VGTRPPHQFNGSLAGDSNGSAGNSYVLGATSLSLATNIYADSVSEKAAATATGAARISILRPSGPSSNAFEFSTNTTAQTAGTNIAGSNTLIAFANAAGAWTFGPSGYTGLHTVRGGTLYITAPSGTNTNLFIDSTSPTSALITLGRGGLSRWNTTNAIAESGSNSGSDYYWTAYNDAGAFLSNPGFISRSTGSWTLGIPSDNSFAGNNIVGRKNGSSVGAGYVGEKITWATPPGSTQSLTTSFADWTNAFITLNKGLYLIQANVALDYTTGNVAGNQGNSYAQITDSSNSVIQEMDKAIFFTTSAAISARFLGFIPFSFVANVTTDGTIYKIRVKRTDVSGTGTATVYNVDSARSEFFAIRIA
jgi:hypothetical protein